MMIKYLCLRFLSSIGIADVQFKLMVIYLTKIIVKSKLDPIPHIKSYPVSIRVIPYFIKRMKYNLGNER